MLMSNPKIAFFSDALAKKELFAKNCRHSFTPSNMHTSTIHSHVLQQITHNQYSSRRIVFNRLLIAKKMQTNTQNLYLLNIFFILIVFSFCYCGHNSNLQNREKRRLTFQVIVMRQIIMLEIHYLQMSNHAMEQSHRCPVVV